MLLRRDCVVKVNFRARGKANKAWLKWKWNERERERERERESVCVCVWENRNTASAESFAELQTNSGVSRADVAPYGSYDDVARGSWD